MDLRQTIDYPGHTLYYDAARKQPLWVAELFTKESLQGDKEIIFYYVMYVCKVLALSLFKSLVIYLLVDNRWNCLAMAIGLFLFLLTLFITGKATRKHSKFRRDDQVPEEYSAENSDYFKSGWTRGHMAPSADFKFSQVPFYS